MDGFIIRFTDLSGVEDLSWLEVPQTSFHCVLNDDAAATRSLFNTLHPDCTIVSMVRGSIEDFVRASEERI